MDELKLFHSFVNDFWQFVKRNWTADPEDNQYWLDITAEVSALSKKYNNHPAVMQTLCGYMDYLEHEGCGVERHKII